MGNVDPLLANQRSRAAFGTAPVCPALAPRDTADRRAVLLRPTDEGRRIRAEVDRARGADSAELFARLSAADRATLARLLRSLVD